MPQQSKIAVVVVTFNRPNLLAGLLSSLQRQSVLPQWIVVVDNASTDNTPDVIFEASKQSVVDIVSITQTTNVGGAGGFSVGVAKAIELGADWLWVMDDDVEAMPNGIEKLSRWGERFLCIHGRRYDADGAPFFFQPNFNEWLGVPLPIIGNPFAETDHIPINAGCFEGMFIHKSVVAQIGLPDPRFFLTWDDAVYGWLASKITRVVLVDDFVLRRMRHQRQINLGLRHLNDASDLSRFYVMRNRTFVANYFKRAGVFSPLGFMVGTMLTLMKEIVRMVAVERRPMGLKALLRGMAAAKSLKKEDWKPMMPLR